VRLSEADPRIVELLGESQTCSAHLQPAQQKKEAAGKIPLPPTRPWVVLNSFEISAHA
jgi:hypothetical protein